MLERGIPDLVAYWHRSALSAVDPKKLLLVSDFDGTLSEIVLEPGRSRAMPESVTALKRLVGRLGMVAVLSSRTRKDLERLVPVPGIKLIGDSGMDRPSPVETRALRRFSTEAARLLGATPGVWLETKPCATSIHYRRTASSSEDVMRLIEPLAKELGLFCGLGRRVIEARLREAPKGLALAALVRRVRPGGVVCLGDDEGDSPMFEVVSGLAEPRMAVGVASPETPPGVFADCDLVVSGPQEISELLTTIAGWASHTEPWRAPPHGGQTMVYR